jgi:hypothetical protein
MDTSSVFTEKGEHKIVHECPAQCPWEGEGWNLSRIDGGV